MVAHACNTITWEADYKFGAIWDIPSAFRASLNYAMKFCLKKIKKMCSYAVVYGVNYVGVKLDGY